MATATSVPQVSPNPPRTGVVQDKRLLISLAPLAPDALDAVLTNLAQAFPAQRDAGGVDASILVATPDPGSRTLPAESPLRLTGYTPAASAPDTWTLQAADYINAHELMRQNGSTACLLLGPEAQSLRPEALRALADAVLAGEIDLAIPRYELGPREALVNSAILYPATRALYGARPRFPLPPDLALSARMAERLATTAQRFTAANQNAAFVWPVAEASSGGLGLAEVPAGSRILPTPDVADLNTLLAQVAGSLFADIDLKASFWQRARLAYSPKAAAAQVEAASAEPLGADEPPDLAEVQPMLDSFRLAYTNLHEIWSLVLPPNSLLGLKKLSLMPAASFRMADALWARIVYDFILAYRLRTLNRGHLLGALTPLYLAWVASHLLLAGGATTGASAGLSAEAHIEAQAAAFEADKPYLVSRWRWPDRFNP